MSKTETPEFVTVIEPTYVEVQQGEETFEVRKYDSGALQCPECRGACDTKSGLKYHLTTQHNITARAEYDCANENCDETFTALRSRDKTYCSQQCFYDARHGNTETCEQCGDVIEAAPSYERKYCSVECQSAAHRRTESCPVCGDTFNPSHTDQVYCSRDCYHEQRGDA